MRVAIRRDWPWATLVVVVACVLLAVAPAALIERLSGNRSAILQGEFWRLWSGHVVHFSLRHALIDSATLLVISGIAEAEFGSRRVALLLLVGAPLMSIGMMFATPELIDYRGASAIAVMLATAVGVSWWRSRAASRCVLGVLALGLLAKIGCDAVGMSLTLAELPDAVRVAWQGHLLGAVLGGLWFLGLARMPHAATRSNRGAFPRITPSISA